MESLKTEHLEDLLIVRIHTYVYFLGEFVELSKQEGSYDITSNIKHLSLFLDLSQVPHLPPKDPVLFVNTLFGPTSIPGTAQPCWS